MSDNVVIRTPNAARGQGMYRAISQRTGWEYEHDETDEQIDSLEEIILRVREESGAASDNDGYDDPSGHVLKGRDFGWSRDADGDVILATAWTEPGDGSVNLGKRGVLEGAVWRQQRWAISPAGDIATVED